MQGKKYVPDVQSYTKVTNTSRYTILKHLLESKNPGVVLECILSRCNIYDLAKYAFYKGKFDDIIKEEYDKEKLANGTGHDSLHNLAGVSEDMEIPDSAWVTVGYKIARMTDFNRRDYVGMINFLHVSCDIYTEIHKHLVTLSKGKFESASRNYKGSMLINENNEPFFSNSINTIDDVVKMCAYALTRLSDIDCSDIEDEINNIDTDVDDDGIELTADALTDQYGNIITDVNETKGYRGVNGKGKGDLIQTRETRGNGTGGLKEFVGVPKGNDLTYGDMKRIAVKIIKNANPEECTKALNYVNYLGSACNSFYNLRKGYLSGISNINKKSGHTTKNGYGKRNAKTNKVINGSTFDPSNKNKTVYKRNKWTNAKH